MNRITLLFHKMGSPPWFYRFSGKLLPWLWALFLVCAAVGLYLGLFKAPPDYLQGESARIMYIHVPAAWMSMMIYVLMAAMGFVGLVWHVRIAEILAMCSAPVGA
ncbi:MAG: heme ABC transporter permease, partial [Xanthomonadales bacterium]|nr:heme ABC transporter permease [Xanthomonadales bacterium]